LLDGLLGELLVDGPGDFEGVDEGETEVEGDWEGVVLGEVEGELEGWELGECDGTVDDELEGDGGIDDGDAPRVVEL